MDIYSNTTTYLYNADNQVTSSTDVQGVQTYSYDYAGNLAGETWTPTGTTVADQILTLSYDGDNRVTVSSDSSGTTTTIYDGDGNATSVDVAGSTTEYQYDTSSDETLTLTPLTTSTFATTTNVYDKNGNLLTTTDPDNNVTSFTYNGDNELISQTSTMGTSTLTTTASA